MICRLGVLVVVAAYTSVTSALPPCICTREMKPVCGTDGETYNNMCLLRCQQQSNPSLELQSRGSCRGARETRNKETCICTLEYNPVCGSDGRTYPNRCAMDCDPENRGNVDMVHEGECRSKREVAAERMCLCPYNYAPVCGSDGETYGNECSLKCKDNVEVAYRGACKDKREVENEGPACFCTFENDPVCGSNGKTYDNMCALECEGETVQLAYKGECRVKREDVTIGEPAPCVCTRETKPVCGTDGQTYSNACLLNCVSQQREDLHILHPGRCTDVQVREVNLDAQPACTCTRNLKPVCASDGQTYSNECIMRCSGNGLTVQSDGPCDNSGWPKPNYPISD